MGKVIVVALVLLAASLALPQTRPTVMTYSEPVLYPVYLWRAQTEMERIGAELTNFENQYYKLPTSSKNFPKWLASRFHEERERIDSWGTEYRFRIWPDSFAVISAGPDREHGTEDDIPHALDRLSLRLQQR